MSYFYWATFLILLGLHIYSLQVICSRNKANDVALGLSWNYHMLTSGVTCGSHLIQAGGRRWLYIIDV